MKPPQLLVVLFGLAGFGCATKSLPPGTPPPEYEKRTFEPWPNAASDAGADAEASPAAPAGPAPAEAPPSATPLDAGPATEPSRDAF
jgi:hypothetical protein